jgi:hypothetical protein
MEMLAIRTNRSSGTAIARQYDAMMPACRDTATRAFGGPSCRGRGSAERSRSPRASIRRGGPPATCIDTALCGLVPRFPTLRRLARAPALARHVHVVPTYGLAHVRRHLLAECEYETRHAQILHSGVARDALARIGIE